MRICLNELILQFRNMTPTARVEIASIFIIQICSINFAQLYGKLNTPESKITFTDGCGEVSFGKGIDLELGNVGIGQIHNTKQE